MQRWAPERERPRRRPGQPSFSSTLLDAICDSLDDPTGGPGAAAERAAARAAGSAAKKQQDAALHCYYYYYKPALAASHRAAPSPADECSGSGRGYFSSSEVEYSQLRRLRPIRTSGGAGAAASVAPAEKQRRRQPQTAPDKARKPSARGGCRRPASPGARLASLLNAIFSGKRHSARQHPAPADEEPEPACCTAPSSARPCCPAKKTPSETARARTSRNRGRRTVRFLDIDGEVAVAAAAAGCRRFPVVEVEGSDGGEESSDASSDLFELENLAAVAPANGRSGCRRACGDELPVFGTTGGAGLRHDVGRRHRRPFGHGSLALDRSFRW